MDSDSDASPSPPSSPNPSPKKKACVDKACFPQQLAPIDSSTVAQCSATGSWSDEKRLSQNTAQLLMGRQSGVASRACRADLGGRYLPQGPATDLGRFQSRLFCGMFSKTGDKYLLASQNGAMRIYDSRKVYQRFCRVPPRGAQMGGRAFGPQPLKTILCKEVGWAVVSTDFSPDEKWVAYSSWSNNVHLCNTGGEYEIHEALPFEDSEGHFCLFSIQFSPNATHIAGGSSNYQGYLYNLERKQVMARLVKHDNDVNAVAFADESSHILLSGGDDTTVLLWDLRCHQAPVGHMTGHEMGITCISPRGDGRHFITNSKDNTVKLWDLRQGMGAPRRDWELAIKQPQTDYRFGHVRAPRRHLERPRDMSVKTFQGHKVMRTLVRCGWSPLHTTGQRYVISGDGDGDVFIWDVLTGEVKEHLEHHGDVVRDVSWHPYLPLIASASWDSSVGLWGCNGQEEDQSCAVKSEGLRHGLAHGRGGQRLFD